MPFYPHRPSRIWKPSDLGGGLSLWLDAADPTTVTIATGVSQWLDKSGRSNHVLQATGANQPSYVAPSSANLGSVVFTTSNTMQSASLAAQPLTLTKSYSFAMVLTLTTQSFGDILNFGGSNFQIGTNPGTGSLCAIFYQKQFSGNLMTATSITVNTQYVLFGTQQIGSQAFYINSAPGGTGSNATDCGTPSSFLIGSSQGISCNEVLVFPSIASTNFRYLVEGYLAWKWGQRSQLPTTHPYKLAPPRRMT